MTDVRLLAPGAFALGPTQGHEAQALARLLPPVCVAAREVAASVMHGVHGRRRAGTGESFWQFRPFSFGEPASRIDWRRSARDDRTYVREREWEAAQTVWLWVDRSPSMWFVSGLARQSKIERALVVGLATADLLVRGGERVGFIGRTRPIASRAVVDRLAEALLADPAPGAELPPPRPLAPRTRAVLVGDCLSDAGEVAATLQVLAAEGARGHLLAVADPVEETFPFSGHVELADSDSPARLRLGEARGLRDRYLERLAAHREALAAACRRFGWTFTVHRTDRPATDAVMRLSLLIGDAPGSPAGNAGAA